MSGTAVFDWMGFAVLNGPGSINFVKNNPGQNDPGTYPMNMNNGTDLFLTRDEVVKINLSPLFASVPMYIAWRTGHKGKAFEWWVGRLEHKEAQQCLLG